MRVRSFIGRWGVRFCLPPCHGPWRLTLRSCTGVLLLAATWALSLSAQPTPAVNSNCVGTTLLPDPDFQRGVVLLRPEPGAKVPIGVVPPSATAPPAWTVAQWSSRYPLDLSHVVRSTDAIVLSNCARELVISPARRTIYMRLNGRLEFDDRPREAGSPWPHLLLETHVQSSPRLADLAALHINLEARLDRPERPTAVTLNPRVNAAQFLFYLTVQNRTKNHPAYGDYLWVGVCIFDSRHQIFPGHAAKDTGTGKFIVHPPTTNFTSESLHNGHWCKISGDLLPFIYDAIRTARSRGYLPGDLPPEEHRLGKMNLGWEVTGPFDAAIEIRGFSLTIQPRSARDPREQSKPEFDTTPRS